jgi:hypothetical protein
VLLDVETVKLYVPSEAGFGEKLQLAPLGSPLHNRLTLELNPPLPVIVTE